MRLPPLAKSVSGQSLSQVEGGYGPPRALGFRSLRFRDIGFRVQGLGFSLGSREEVVQEIFNTCRDASSLFMPMAI